MMRKKNLFLIALIALASVSVKAQDKGPTLNHVAIYVYDLAKSTAFYRDIIGIDTIAEPFHDGRHTWFKIGPHSHLHIISGAKEIVAHDKNSHLCFSVSSIEDVMKRLEKANIEWTNWAGTGKEPTLRVDGVKQIYFTDPDGYWVEINNDTY